MHVVDFSESVLHVGNLFYPTWNKLHVRVWRRSTSTVPSTKHRPSYFFGALLSNALNI